MNFNENFNLFIKENAFENVIQEMAAILSLLQCVNDEAVSVMTSRFQYVKKSIKYHMI